MKVLGWVLIWCWSGLVCVSWCCVLRVSVIGNWFRVYLCCGELFVVWGLVLYLYLG